MTNFFNWFKFWYKKITYNLIFFHHHDLHQRLDSIEEYNVWAEQEPFKNVSNICKECSYYGKCLTEHYRYVKDLDSGCNGYKHLIDWYKNETKQS